MSNKSFQKYMSQNWHEYKEKMVKSKIIAEILTQ